MSLASTKTTLCYSLQHWEYVYFQVQYTWNIKSRALPVQPRYTFITAMTSWFKERGAAQGHTFCIRIGYCHPPSLSSEEAKSSVENGREFASDGLEPIPSALHCFGLSLARDDPSKTDRQRDGSWHLPTKESSPIWASSGRTASGNDNVPPHPKTRPWSRSI